jgi:eukaryotic-like serine/threonine-protein kinase
MADWSALGTASTQVGFPFEATVSQAEGGQLLAGRYELLALIGAGGMGRVYRARDRELDELVALKVLAGQLVDSDKLLERFRQEVKLARRVTHRNVARTYDIGEHGAERFLTMELVEGETLSSLFARQGSLPPSTALPLAIQICAGLVAAHAAGVVHRDLKPDNVLLARDGRAVITDFGIACVRAVDAPKKVGRETVGTPTYMAPEQVEAREDIDGRADVYAFGAVLYEMLTGARAWPGGEPYAVAMARFLQPPPDPRVRCPELPDELAEIVLRALARERDERFADAESLGRALAAMSLKLSQFSPTATVPLRPSERLAPREKTVAVLPFRNIGSPDDAYLAEGLHEDLLDVLSTVRGLRVRTGGLSRGAADADADVLEHGRKLGVDVVVEGSVRRVPEGLRVSARLVGAQDGFQIWSARFERPTAGVFALNDEVARAIAAALSTAATNQDRDAPTDPFAIDLYLRGRFEMAQYWMSDHARALELLTEALARAPEDPTILSAYATARLRSAFLSDQPVTGDLGPLVARALRGAPGQGEPWVALAALRWNAEDDPVGAARAVKRALQVAPSLAEANDLAGRLLLEAGEVDEAIALLDRTLWLDPFVPWARIDRMRAAAYQRDWAALEAIFGARTDGPWQQQGRVSLLRYLLWRGDVDSLARLPAPAGVADERSALFIRVLEETMRTGLLSDPARELLRGNVERLPPRTRGRRLLAQIACELHVFTEDDDEAQRYLEMAVVAGLLDRSWIEHNPLLRRYRGARWFEAARATVGERAAAIVAAWRGPPEPLIDSR